MKSSGYAAEYGGATGGVISAITKSGSNQFHGSLGTYYRNNDMQSAPRQGWRINPFSDCATCTGVPDSSPRRTPASTTGTRSATSVARCSRTSLWFYVGAATTGHDNQRTHDLHGLAGAVRHEGHDSWSDANYYNWNGTTQLSRDCGCGSAARTAARPTAAASPTTFSPTASTFADGTPTNGFNTRDLGCRSREVQGSLGAHRRERDERHLRGERRLGR